MSDPAVKNAASDDNRAAQSHGLGDVSFTESDQEVDLSAAKAPADDNVVEVNLGNLPRVTEQISQAEPGALLTLGRNGDIKVDASPKKSKVSRVHCTIIKNRDGTITVRDGKLNEPSRNGTFYIAPDGEEIRIRAEQRLPPGSVIRLGPDRLVQLPAYEIQSPACDKTFVIGRHAGCSPRLPDSYDKISREHATVFCDNNGKLWIHDGGLAGRSELGTCLVKEGGDVRKVGRGWKPLVPGELMQLGDCYFKVAPPVVEPVPLDVVYCKTEQAIDRVAKSDQYFCAPDGTHWYQDRHVIARDTEIEGGLYIGAGVREAIVVDSEKDQELQKAHATLEKRLNRLWLIDIRRKGDGWFSFGVADKEERILKQVYKLVQEIFPLSGKRAVVGVQELLDRCDLNGDQKVYLGFFMRAGEGVCRHRALLAAALIERLIKTGRLSGKVSVDRSARPALIWYERGQGHAFVRYVSPAGRVTIIDPMQNYLGPLRTPATDSNGRRAWDHRRPEDLR